MELTFLPWAEVLMLMISSLFSLSLLTIVSLIKSSLRSVLLALLDCRELAIILTPLASNSFLITFLMS